MNDNPHGLSNGSKKADLNDDFYVDDRFQEYFLDSQYDKSTRFGKFMHLRNWRFYIKNFGRKKLRLTDIPRLPSNDESEKQYNILKNAWIVEVEQAKKNKRINGWFLCWLCIFGFLAQFSVLYQAICMKNLINYTNQLTVLRNIDRNSTIEHQNLDQSIANTKYQIYTTCLIMVLLQFLYTNFINVYNFHTVLIGYRLKISISSMVYRKTIKLSKSAFANTSIGQIQTILSGDMNRLESIFYLVAYPFIGIILTIVTVCVLWPYLTYYVFVGLLVLFRCVPAQSYLSKAFSKVRLLAAYKTDERMKILNEFIPAIRVIKMYCFESEFAKKISQARVNEVTKIRDCLYLFSYSMAIFYTGAKVVIYATLVCYVLFSDIGQINSELVYVSFATFNKLSFICLLYLPHFFLSSINGMIAIERIDKFLSLDEIDKADLDVKENLMHDKALVSVKELYSSHAAKTANFLFDEKAKKIFKNKTTGEDNRCFVHEDLNILDDGSEQNKNYVIKNVSFDVKPGEILTIVGPVGSGKSSILLSVLGDLLLKRGFINVKGRYSYASQESWTFAGTVKENILFGSSFDQEKYEEVVKVCALERDMTLFPQGAETIVGERGVALSGGQRARINLARALYYDADIYLLDDPLSAVDPHVAKHIFKEAIQGYLSDKIVILVTHQLQFVKNSTNVLLIKDGEQIAYGDYNDPENDFSSFVDLIDLNEQKEQQVERNRQDSSRFGSCVSIHTIANQPVKILSRQDSVDSIQQSRLFEDEDLFNQQIAQNEGECRIREVVAESTVTNGKGAITYIKAGMTWVIAPVLVILFLAAQLSYSSADYFLKLWTSYAESNNTENSNEHSFMSQFSMNQSIYVYTGIIMCLIVFSLCRSLMFFKFCMKSSVTIHDTLFQKIVRAPIKFFDTGSNQFQVLNRFSKDLQIIDDVLPYRFYDFIDITITDISICFLIFLINRALIIPIIILFFLVLFVRKFYLETARSIAAIEGMAKSPMVQHLTSSVNGVTTIKALKAQKRFIRRFDRFQNDYSSALFLLIVSRRWLVYTMDTIQSIFIGSILFVLCIYLPDASTMGLIVSNILMLTSEFQWLVINWTDFSTFLTSVERLDQYSEVEQEPSLISAPNKRPKSSWPEYGRIEFKNVSMRYFNDESFVLKNLNFTIDSRESIGVVGRTGAGKSSLISALFRMYDYEGEIIIDGINVKEIGLHELRKQIAIIPQEPVLFTGTVRSNLNLIGEVKDDSILWDALREAQLERTIKEMDGGLDAEIIDGGSNFSIGQKQLICLARAVLRRNKILVLDEATANCDPQTDALIQKTLRTVFKDTTTITVAHRLNTIIDSNKILVMEAGELKEFDTPYNLIRIPSSLFCSMVNATGPQNSKILKIAAQNASRRKLND